MKKAFFVKLALVTLVALSGSANAQDDTNTKVADSIDQIAEVADSQESVSDVVAPEPVADEAIVEAPVEGATGELLPTLPVAQDWVVSDAMVATPMLGSTLPVGSACNGCGQTATPMFSTPMAQTMMPLVSNSGCGQAVYTPTVSACGCCSGCVGQVAYQQPLQSTGIVTAAPVPTTVVQQGVSSTNGMVITQGTLTSQAPIVTSNAIVSSPVTATQIGMPMTTSPLVTLPTTTYASPTTTSPVTTYATPVATAPTTAGCSSCGATTTSVAPMTYVDSGAMSYTTGTANSYSAPMTTNDCCSQNQTRRAVLRTGLRIGILRSRNN